MALARYTHIVLHSFFLQKGLFLVIIGLIAASGNVPFVSYKTLAEETTSDSVSEIGSFFSTHFGPVALTIGIVSLILAVLGIVLSVKKLSSRPIIVFTLFLFIFFVFELFVLSVMGVYSSLKTKDLDLRDLVLRYTELEFRCCGINGRTDFKPQSVPKTCLSYTRGCRPYFGKLHREDVIIVSVLGVLTFITFLVLASSIAFWISIRKKDS